MARLTIAKARANLSDIVAKVSVSTKHFTVTKNGKPKVVIMGIDEYESLVETLEIMSDKRAMKGIRQAQKELAQGKYCTLLKDRNLRPLKGL